MSSIDHLKIPDEKKRYINERLNPLLTELVTDCLKSCPSEPALFILEWLRKKKGLNTGSGNGNSGSGGSDSTTNKASSDDAEKIRQENEKLRNDIIALQRTIKDTHSVMATLETNLNTTKTKDKDGNNVDEGDLDDEEEEEDNGDDDLADELPEHLQKKAHEKGPRQSVSAEAYGAWNKKTAFTPVVVGKSEVQKERLRKVLGNSFMFSALDDKDFNVLIDAMKEVQAESGEILIKFGEDGDFLFVVESGTLECYKDINGESTVVKTCEAGDVFGELALLYNTTRAANVRVKNDSSPATLWKLDRETFNHIVKDAAAKKRSKYESFLQQVTLLNQLTPYEQSQVSDALQSHVYQTGENIVTEGDKGDRFFIVESGNPVAEKNGNVVMSYSPGEFFGEISLLLEQPRLATVKAVNGPCKVLSLDRKSFKRLLGPLDEIMRRAVNEKYN